jgi:hypothetical protein
MLNRMFLCFALLGAMCAWSQAQGSGDQSQMQTPPLVSGDSYPTEVGSEERSNYLSAGVYLTGAYDDNVEGSGAGKPVSDVSFMIHPTITLSQSTPRQNATVTYSPGFTFYQPTSELNQSSESVIANYRYRLSPHISVDGNESFNRSSGIFSQSDSTSGGAVSGSQGPSEVVAPFAEQITDSTNGGISYQYSLNGMIGAGATYGKLSYPNPSQASGLFDSTWSGGSAFYSARLSSSQYLGFRYQYIRGLTVPLSEGSEVQAHNIEPFYTIFLKRTFSISVSAGPQYLIANEAGSPLQSKSWEPSETASMGWQGMHTSFAAGFMRAVSGGTGLNGAFETTRANAMARYQISRMWELAGNANYQIQKNAEPGVLPGGQGGNTLSAGFQIDRAISEHFRIQMGYNRLHQSYANVASLKNAPDDNHEYVSVSYQISRPLGR